MALLQQHLLPTPWPNAVLLLLLLLLLLVLPPTLTLPALLSGLSRMVSSACRSTAAAAAAAAAAVPLSREVMIFKRSNTASPSVQDYTTAVIAVLHTTWQGIPVPMLPTTTAQCIWRRAAAGATAAAIAAAATAAAAAHLVCDVWPVQCWVLLVLQQVVGVVVTVEQLVALQHAQRGSVAGCVFKCS
jgi:hypothetical protein